VISEACINDCPLLQGCYLGLEVDIWAPSEDAEDARCVVGAGVWLGNVVPNG